jgi:flagellar hook-associated protein 2
MGTSGVDWSTLASGSDSTSTAGIDVPTVVSEVLQPQTQQVTQWQTEETTYNNQTTALQQLNTQLQTLLTDANNLNDPLGSFDAMDTSVSDSSVLSASAGSGAVAGTHTISVTSLATTSSEYSNEVASSSTAIGTGAFTLQVGSGSASTIAVDSSDDTLTGLAAAINKQNLGVTASVITDAGGSRLTLVSNSSGAAGNITISGNTTGLSFDVGSKGQDASLTVDGVPIDSSSNTITTAISGVTLNLTGTTSPSSPVTLQVSPDTSQVASAINTFVSDYNTVITNLNSQFTSGGSSGTTGTLMGDTAAEMVQSTLLGDAAGGASGNGAISSLAALGITMNEDGTLTVDSSQLSTALTNNFQQVQNFFQATSTGFAQKFASDLNNLTDPTNGPIAIDLNGITSSVSSLQSEITDFQANLTTEQQSLTTYYDNVNVTLQSLPSLLASVNAQLGSLSTT